MGLITDKLFFEILRTNDEFMERIGGRIYNTVISDPDFDDINCPVPYCIIMFAGMNNNDGTKDSLYEGPTDNVDIEIELTANDPDELTDIARMIRRIIYRELAYIQRHAQLWAGGEPIRTSDGKLLQVPIPPEELVKRLPIDYRFSAGDKTYFDIKPCYAIVLKYQCEVTNDLYYEEYEQED